MPTRVNRSDARDLALELRGRGFLKARELSMENRKIRAVCQHFPDRFLSTQRGYKLVDEASDAEIQNAIADLRSRIGYLAQRAVALQMALAERSTGEQRSLAL